MALIYLSLKLLTLHTVNNAGIGAFGETLAVKPSELTHLLDINVKGPIFVAQAVVPVMPPGGRIVNISSIASKLGDDMIPMYGASKAAIDSLTWSWAKEVRFHRELSLDES